MFAIIVIISACLAVLVSVYLNSLIGGKTHYLVDLFIMSFSFLLFITIFCIGLKETKSEIAKISEEKFIDFGKQTISIDNFKVIVNQIKE